MGKSHDPQLAKLAKYGEALNCDFDTNMFFVGMPETREEAEQQATETAGRLQEYAKFNIKPLVIMEPTYKGGKERTDLRILNNAKNSEEYHERLDTYFRTLRQAGITDEQMGTWVPFPEPNLPEWKDGVTSPDVFRNNFVPVAQAIKTHFRNAHVSIMLDSATYPDGDVKYAKGTNNPTALLPYVTGIPEQDSSPLVDSIGLQGFPWELTDGAADYLPAQSALVCAARLGLKQAWLNTGSFSRRKEGDQTIAVSPQLRATQLAGALGQAVAIQKAGVAVRVNVFAQNDFPKSPDWSYSTPQDVFVLKEGVKVAKQLGILVSLFDSKA
jgi:hypothetical protein